RNNLEIDKEIIQDKSKEELGKTNVYLEKYNELLRKYEYLLHFVKKQHSDIEDFFKNIQWARITIPILWENPFKHYENNEIDSLRKVICYDLDVKEYFKKGKIPIKDHDSILFSIS
ncbi:477_t:CDS:2, partial [Scutellospora calospora]